MTKSTATSAFFVIFRKSNQNARSIRLWRGLSGSLIFSYNTAKYREAMTLEKSVLIHMGDNTAMDMDSGELHIISSWDDEDEDD